jgi:hypothetical protein
MSLFGRLRLDIKRERVEIKEVENQGVENRVVEKQALENRVTKPSPDPKKMPRAI